MRPQTSRLHRPLLVAVWGLVLFPAIARAQESELEVGVRTNVVDKSITWTGKAPKTGGGGLGKIYGILSVQLVKSDQRLVKPVNENAILQLLSEELNKNGFQLYAPGTKPEIVLTVSYGRAELHNPYIRDTGEIGGDSRGQALLQQPGTGAGVSNDSGATTQVITGAFSQQLMDEKSPGYEAKLQKAGYEKLYLRVIAWAYPIDSKAKSKMLWKTTMVVDDPDHRDLNAIAQKMLEAGAPYFDKEIREPEAEIHKPLPDGRVNVGTPEVVPPKAK